MTQELIQWVVQQGPVVVIMLLFILGFFRYVVPAFQKIQDKHDENLKQQSAEHRERADKQLATFERALANVVETHERAIDKLIANLFGDKK